LINGRFKFPGSIIHNFFYEDNIIINKFKTPLAKFTM
jgi:hypothetical protein